MPRKRRPRGRRTALSAPPGLEVRRLGAKGRGVFATRRFRKGERVERSPVIALPRGQWKHVARTALETYAYDWGADGRGCALVLGLGSLINHSYEPTVENAVDLRQQAMDWIALRTIEPGEEITVNYNDEDSPDDPLWFEVRR